MLGLRYATFPRVRLHHSECVSYSKSGFLALCHSVLFLLLFNMTFSQIATLHIHAKTKERHIERVRETMGGRGNKSSNSNHTPWSLWTHVPNEYWQWNWTGWTFKTTETCWIKWCRNKMPSSKMDWQRQWDMGSLQFILSSRLSCYLVPSFSNCLSVLASTMVNAHTFATTLDAVQ